MRKTVRSFLLKLVLLLAAYVQLNTAQAQGPKTRILFLLDASGSMYAKMDDEIRIDVAKRMLSRLVDSLKYVNDLQIALRVYGHQSPTYKQDCKDTKLEVPFGYNNHEQIKKRLKGINPKGTTLIAYSLTQAAYDFPSNSKNTRNVIILITDGIEECKGDPCAVSQALQAKGVILKPFVIGIGNADFRTAFECVGRVYNADTKASFENVLNVVITQALNNTTAQVNLLDVDGRASETNVNMTFYDSHSGQMEYNYLHAINDRGFPDTIELDPIFKYDIVVHTTPPVQKNNVEIFAGRHNTIPIDAPQGFIQMKVDGLTSYDKLQCIVRKAGQHKTIHVQEFNTKKKYIVGKYDLEILSLPRIYVNNVDVKQSHTTTINIPQPGKVNISSVSDVHAAVYTMKADRLEWVCDIELQNKRQTLILQPGKYKIIYRSVFVNKALSTFEKNFSISSGGSTSVRL